MACQPLLVVDALKTDVEPRLSHLKAIHDAVFLEVAIGPSNPAADLDGDVVVAPNEARGNALHLPEHLGSDAASCPAGLEFVGLEKLLAWGLEIVPHVLVVVLQEPRWDAHLLLGLQKVGMTPSPRPLWLLTIKSKARIRVYELVGAVLRLHCLAPLVPRPTIGLLREVLTLPARNPWPRLQHLCDVALVLVHVFDEALEVVWGH
mmetsp:Transcript_47368/g.96804  ORF Transcript_47368/g.96804 Transcript_47368/m.96804 type:complete len:205 (+) Transcript_47368:1285-1899(+)